MEKLKKNDEKHKYCKVCSKRLDRVKKYSQVQEIQLLDKINYIKQGKVPGDYVCSTCTQYARTVYKNRSIDETKYEIQQENDIGPASMFIKYCVKYFFGYIFEKIL